MIKVKAIAYRVLTGSDYFNIYKPPGTEQGGGGQLYIDFPTAAVSVSKWRRFFTGVNGVTEKTVTNGPRWRCPIRSINVPGTSPQRITIYQRRPQTVCIANQNINSKKACRLAAWHPDNEFPQPQYPQKRGDPPQGLTVFLVRTYEGSVYAGWLPGPEGQCLSETTDAEAAIAALIDPDNVEGSAGVIEFDEGTLFLTNDTNRPIFTTQDIEDTHNYLDDLFDEDDESDALADKAERERYQKIRARNRRAVQDLKSLYKYQCQLTGTQFTFLMPSGRMYVEAHHLVPLGDGGADNPFNIVIVSAHIHRMFHYAAVRDFDLKQIAIGTDGWGTLPIVINNTTYTMRWHPDHLAAVTKHT